MLPAITLLKSEERQTNNLKIFVYNPLFQFIDNLTIDFFMLSFAFTIPSHDRFQFIEYKTIFLEPLLPKSQTEKF